MAKYNNINNGMSYYWAKEYKKMYNKYPKLDEVNEKELQLIQKQMENYIIHYQDDFYLDKDNNIYRDTFLLSSKDLINVSSIRGESNNKDNIIIDRNLIYLTLHSTNPEETLKWLESLDLEEFSSEYDYGYQTIISPFDMRDRLMGDIKDAVIKQVITLVVIILIMSLCMFFIMKASIMNRIKEIGIYRAIGVSKKNLIFKYLIEVIILTTFTIFVGYAISSFFIIVAANVSKSIITVLYYPWYLALFVFIFLYFISIVSGLIPIISLIRRTPSEILAKYDI
jgi:ABC-type antimicrobial peptide transport system permease subunit